MSYATTHITTTTPSSSTDAEERRAKTQASTWWHLRMAQSQAAWMKYMLYASTAETAACRMSVVAAQIKERYPLVRTR
jgi:hypothetical protein